LAELRLRAGPRTVTFGPRATVPFSVCCGGGQRPSQSLAVARAFRVGRRFVIPNPARGSESARFQVPQPRGLLVPVPTIGPALQVASSLRLAVCGPGPRARGPAPLHGWLGCSGPMITESESDCGCPEACRAVALWAQPYGVSGRPGRGGHAPSGTVGPPRPS
jgi:hypothetical protein